MQWWEELEQDLSSCDSGGEREGQRAWFRLCAKSREGREDGFVKDRFGEVTDVSLVQTRENMDRLGRNGQGVSV